MPKVHPKAEGLSRIGRRRELAEERREELQPVILTVWRKSLLLTCSGFTVFDLEGNLAFRVDNYEADGRGEVVLMDAAGKPLLTGRRKKLSLGDQWLIYAGETNSDPIFSVKKQMGFLPSKHLAQVTVPTAGSRAGGSPRRPAYEIEGSYRQRSCVIYDDERQVVAEILRKEAVPGVTFGGDVFRLVVRPELDQTVAMAIVVLLDRMFESSSSSSSSSS